MLSIISFTKTGKRLSENIREMLKTDMEVCLYTKCRTCMEEDNNSSVLSVLTSVNEWAGEQMQKQNAILFIGACGIAVRAIAPFLTDKLHDTPVLVIDEKGKYIIPILSGHMGGANALANILAGKMGAQPVITTATDINHQFAVDLFAKRNALSIVNKDGIVKVSSKVLAGEEVTMSIETGHSVEIKYDTDVINEGAYPYPGVRLISYPPREAVDIVITSKEDIFDTALLLRPKEYIIGMGCKKGKSAEEIAGFINKKLSESGISTTQVYALASISQKMDEPGLIEWCNKERVLFLTYTAAELQEIKGDFEESSFVKEHVGVGNVCERATLKACGKNGKLIAPKLAENGMTIAIAKREWTVCFYDE